MKNVSLIVAICFSLAVMSIACAGAKMPKTIIGASEARAETTAPPAPIQTVPVSSIPVVPDPQPQAAMLPQPQPPQAPAQGSVVGEGNVMFKFNQKVTAFYVTYYGDENKRLQKFPATDHLEFTKVKPPTNGKYHYVNFLGEGGRWILDNGGGANPNFEAWVSFDNGVNWRLLTSADAEHVSGKYWNFRH